MGVLKKHSHSQILPPFRRSYFEFRDIATQPSKNARRLVVAAVSSRHLCLLSGQCAKKMLFKWNFKISNAEWVSWSCAKRLKRCQSCFFESLWTEISIFTMRFEVKCTAPSGPYERNDLKGQGTCIDKGCFQHTGNRI